MMCSSGKRSESGNRAETRKRLGMDQQAAIGLRAGTGQEQKENDQQTENAHQTAVIRPIDIRLAEEAEQIWYMQHAAYQIEAQWAGLENAPPLMETIEELRQCSERFVGYERDGLLLGALSYKLSQRGVLEICRLMVDPPSIRQGIGEQLLTYVLRHEPHQTAAVFVSVRNVPALALYSKHGFQERERSEMLPGIVLAKMERQNA